MSDELAKKYDEIAYALEEMGYSNSGDDFTKEINKNKPKYSFISMREYYGNSISEYIQLNLSDSIFDANFDHLFRIKYLDVKTSTIINLIKAFENFARHEVCKNIAEHFGKTIYEFNHGNENIALVFVQFFPNGKLPYMISFSMDGECFLLRSKTDELFVNVNEVKSLKDLDNKYDNQ